MSKENTYFTRFKTDITGMSLPSQFNFPFYYQPHELCVIAAKELQAYLETQTDWVHNFGLKESMSGTETGKMFGVLIVKDTQGNIGYLSAFSGKLANSNDHVRFVPPVYDVLKVDGFYKIEEAEISNITAKIDLLEQNEEIEKVLKQLKKTKATVNQSLEEARKKIKNQKRYRKAERTKAEAKLSPSQYNELTTHMHQVSLNEQFYYKELTVYYNEKIAKIQSDYDALTNEIRALKKERKMRSAAIQQRLFDKYYFLNGEGDQKNLCAIFQQTLGINPPAAAGECAAPKLLQYAFLHNLTPISMAEFWWGAPPGSTIRKHGQFYPACRGKCEPILGHMLKGVSVEKNPLLTAPIYDQELPIVYEDEHILVINKPAEFLSVPGINIEDSVFSRIKANYPDATGPLIVHRLDMSTSGILILAKSKEVHKELQQQFVKRTVIKRYIAKLEGEIQEKEGFINLPLRVDLDNRPHQLVDFEHGKSARTKWEKIRTSNGQTLIYFYPVTGRTHQLRVHASHPLGLNMAIVGDDLYGTKSDRLYLHAESLTIMHPITTETITFQVDPVF